MSDKFKGMAIFSFIGLHRQFGTDDIKSFYTGLTAFDLLSTKVIFTDY